MTSKPVQPGDRCWHAPSYGSAPKLITVRQVRASGWYEHGGITFIPQPFSDLFDTESEAWDGMIARITAQIKRTKHKLRNVERRLKKLRERASVLVAATDAEGGK